MRNKTLLFQIRKRAISTGERVFALALSGLMMLAVAAGLSGFLASRASAQEAAAEVESVTSDDLYEKFKRAFEAAGGAENFRSGGGVGLPVKQAVKPSGGSPFGPRRYPAPCPAKQVLAKEMNGKNFGRNYR